MLAGQWRRQPPEPEVTVMPAIAESANLLRVSGVLSPRKISIFSYRFAQSGVSIDNPSFVPGPLRTWATMALHAALFSAVLTQHS